MHRMLPVALLLLCSISPAWAATGDIVIPDTEPLEDVFDDLEREQNRQDGEIPFYESSDLFPEVDEDTGTIEDRRDDRTEGFLVIRVGAREVVLRDVPLRDWYAPYVRNIAELQLVSGYRDSAGMPTGLFGPADPVTVEQVAKVAVLAAGIDATSCPLPPKNLTSSGGWAASYVSCAEMRSWALFSDPVGDFRRPATREEVVMTILQAFNRPFDVDPTTIQFTDVEQTSMYARAIAKASSDGVVSGYTDEQGQTTGLFGPTNNVTRAEFAKIVSIALQLYQE